MAYSNDVSGHGLSDGSPCSRFFIIPLDLDDRVLKCILSSSLKLLEYLDLNQGNGRTINLEQSSPDSSDEILKTTWMEERLETFCNDGQVST